MFLRSSTVCNLLTKYKWYIITIVGILIVILWLTKGNPKDTPTVEPTKVVQSTTTVEVVPKTSPTDNDLEITQVYRAEVNGAKVEIPVETKDNIKGVVKQEIDLTPVIQMQREVDKKEFKKNWEVGTGIGIENGHVYIPIELQRNYTADKALSVEVHVSADKNPKVTGGEVKHKWLF